MNRTEKVYVGLFVLFCMWLLILCVIGCNIPRNQCRVSEFGPYVRDASTPPSFKFDLSEMIVNEHKVGVSEYSTDTFYLERMPTIRVTDVTIEPEPHEHIYVKMAYSYSDSLKYGMYYGLGWEDDWKPCVCVKCFKINICK